MKRIKTVAYVLIILAATLACEVAGINVDFGGSESSSQSAAAAIEAVIDSPANGSSLPMSSVDISYHANCLDGISAVELSIDGAVVSSIATPGSDQKVVALKYTWQPTLSGSHTIRVRAQNTVGNWSDYASANVTIQAAQNNQALQPAEQEPVDEEPEPTKTAEPTKTPEPTSTPEGVNFFDIKHDKEKFYYGNNSCGSHELTISTRVTNPDDVYVVVLFLRFADKESAAYTKWDSGRAMSKKGDDLYSVTLTSTKIPNYNAYEFAVMRYQIVAQDKQGNNIARTDVMEDLNIEVCTK